MPLKRTPPVSPSRARSDSITRKNKRRRDGSSDADSETYSTLKNDIFKMIEEFKQEQTKNFNKLQETISHQNKEIQSSLDFIAARYDEMQKKLESMELERNKNLAYIQTLEEKIESLETRQNLTCLELRNMPKKPSENKSDLINLVLKTGSALNTQIQQSDIKNIFRINTKSSDTKPIIVEFTTVSMKDNIIKQSKSYNRNNSNNKLSTQTLKLDGPSKPIFIPEHLTHKTRKVFSLARDFSSKNNYSYCWSANGKIYIREKEGAPYHRIESERDLLNLKTK